MVKSITVVEEKSTVEVAPEYQKSLETKLVSELFGQQGFSKGDELTLKYNVIQLDPGNQAVRWMAGHLTDRGSGSITVAVSFVSKEGKEISRIQASGTVTKGGLGASFDQAISQAVDQIVAYSLKNFKAASVN